MPKKLTKKDVEPKYERHTLNANLPILYVDFIDKVSSIYGGTIKSTVIFALNKYLMDHAPITEDPHKRKRVQIDIPKELKDKMLNRIPREAFNQTSFITTALNYLRFNMEMFGDEKVYDTDYLIDFKDNISLKIKVINFRDNYYKSGNVFSILGQTYLDEDEPPVFIELSCPIMLYQNLLEMEIEAGKTYYISKTDKKFTVKKVK